MVRADEERFIPAHAGNSSGRAYASGCGPVHPRARGEQALAPFASSARRGSSPRTRGTAAASGLLRHRTRFIPAHAGNSGTQRRSCPRKPVHPRARGEQFEKFLKDRLDCGSSPRTRGTGPLPAGACESRRFIPAHAGNRCGRGAVTAHPPVHPRARGEQTLPPPTTCAITGSSPRTRGTEGRHGYCRRPLRFIPAHAGNRT